MYRVQVVCEKAGKTFDPRHKIGGYWETDNPAEPMPDRFQQVLAEHGWVERDGKHYCQRHDPALRGEAVTVGEQYVEIAPGVRVRYPYAGEAHDITTIEVQLFEPSEAAAVPREGKPPWLAKPPLIPGT